MTKAEFLEHVNAVRSRENQQELSWEDIPASVYEVVERVYTWHGAIRSKQDIAEIFCLRNGMAVIRAMGQEVLFYQELERLEGEARSELEKAHKRMEQLTAIRRQVESGELPTDFSLLGP